MATSDCPGQTTSPASPWPTTVIALGFIALVGVIFWRASATSNFSVIWAGARHHRRRYHRRDPVLLLRPHRQHRNQPRPTAAQTAARKADQVAAFYAVTDDRLREAARQRNPAAFP